MPAVMGSFHLLLMLVAMVGLFRGTDAAFLKKFERQEDGSVRAFAYKEAAAGGGSDQILCELYYAPSYHKVGWDVLEAQSNPKTLLSDAEQAQCVGELEGAVCTDAIYINYYNTARNWCQGKVCKKVYRFLSTHLDWIEQQITDKAQHDPMWHHVSMFFNQIKGIKQGYDEGQTNHSRSLSLEDLITMNLLNDMDEVRQALGRDSTSRLRGDSHCSAIVKLLPDYQDLLVGHNTWTEYTQMYRMLKKYDLPFRTGPESTMRVPGHTMSFSGYPGVITSGDDFYVTSSRLIAAETTIGNSNASRWQYVQPTGQLFESVRSLIALRLANNGRSWCETFAEYNSGTYNNQWMIVDLRKFKRGKKPGEGTLWILEQIPGYVRFEDQTQRLTSQGYWPSYNVPFYPDVFNLSGNQQLVEQYGDWFSYDKTPRALIFKRNQSEVTGVDSLMYLLRSNEYESDSFARCNCTPPYNAENALAARSDLNPADGRYPFAALGHRPHGATDAKVVNTTLARNLTFAAVCGPTTSYGILPPFTWSQSDYDHLPHLGQPDTFNFPTLLHKWIGKLF